MIISHKYKFIFIKTLKTAGTSLEVFLSQCCGPQDICTPISPHVPPHVARNHEGYFNHISANAIASQVGDEIWKNYFKFCVERNPWDKTLSYYHMMNYRSGGTLPFDRFMKEDDFPLNYPLYTAPHDPNQVLVDRVLRYERLTEDLDGVFKELGIPFSGSLGANAKSEYRTDRRPYQQVYSQNEAKTVESRFAQEIALHGYQY